MVKSAPLHCRSSLDILVERERLRLFSHSSSQQLVVDFDIDTNTITYHRASHRNVTKVVELGVFYTRHREQLGDRRHRNLIARPLVRAPGAGSRFFISCSYYHKYIAYLLLAQLFARGPYPALSFPRVSQPPNPTLRQSRFRTSPPMLRSPTLATIVAGFLLLMTCVVAGTDFSHSCANYYLGNGISDSSGDLFIEAWCHGGSENDGRQRPDLCNRLRLTECFKNLNGNIEPFAENETPGDDSLRSLCDIESCAFRQDAWDGPIMSCYCQDTSGDWQLASVDLNQHIGNEGGYLQCGETKATLDCLYPWTPNSQSELK